MPQRFTRGTLSGEIRFWRTFVRPDPERLATLPLFASLSPEELRGLANYTTLRQELPGTRIIEEGAPGYAFFIVEEGTAVASSGGTELCTLGPGDFFGEIAVVGEGWRTADVTATSPMSVVVMLGRDFRMFEREWPEVSELLKRAMDERLKRSAQLHRG
jgi:CRP-like cAMP-binding protein